MTESAKLQRAKARQAYEPRPAHRLCRNCEHFKFDEQEVEGVLCNYARQFNLRCGLGGFPVLMTATCGMHDFRKGYLKEQE